MKEKVAVTSILANVVLAGSKITIGLFSNSVAILAAGIDSFIDIFHQLLVMLGLKYLISRLIKASLRSL